MEYGNSIKYNNEYYRNISDLLDKIINLKKEKNIKETS